MIPAHPTAFFSGNPYNASIIASWRFNGDGNDNTPNALNLTGDNSPTFIAGLIDQCTELNGTTQSWHRANSALMRPDILTIAQWVRFDNDPGTAEMLCCQYVNAGPRFWRFYKAASGALTFSMVHDGGENAIATTDLMGKDQWRLCMARYNFLNGDVKIGFGQVGANAPFSSGAGAEASGNIPTLTVPVTPDFYIGAMNDGFHFLDGRVDATILMNGDFATVTDGAYLFNSSIGREYPF